MIGGRPVLAVVGTLTPRDHQVGFPTLNGLNGDVTHQLREAVTGVSVSLILKLNGIIVLQLVEILIVAAIFVVNRFRGVVNDSLAIGVVSISIRIILTGNQCVEVKLQNVIPDKLCVVELHLEVLVIGLTDDTLFFRVRYVGRVCRILRTAADVQVVVVLEACLTRNTV